MFVMDSPKLPTLEVENHLSCLFFDFLGAVNMQNSIANRLMNNIALWLVPVQLRPWQCFHWAA